MKNRKSYRLGHLQVQLLQKIADAGGVLMIRQYYAIEHEQDHTFKRMMALENRGLVTVNMGESRGENGIDTECVQLAAKGREALREYNEAAQ